MSSYTTVFREEVHVIPEEEVKENVESSWRRKWVEHYAREGLPLPVLHGMLEQVDVESFTGTYVVALGVHHL